MPDAPTNLNPAGATLFRIIAEASSDVIVTITEESSVVFVNEAVHRVFGYSPKELIGTSLTQLMPHYLRHVHERGLKRYLETGRRHISWEGIELPAVHKSGRALVVEVSFGQFVLDGHPFFTGVIRDVTERKRAETRRMIEASVIRVLTEDIPAAEIPTKVLESICSNLGWKVGELWVVDPANHELHFAAAWHEHSSELKDFVEAGRTFVFTKGVGLPGSVLQSGTSHWISDLRTADNSLRRGIVEKAGLNAGFAFPIRVGGAITAVLEFFSSEIREPDNELLSMLNGIGGQIGQFMVRRRAEEGREALLLREQDARFAAEEANRLKDEFLSTVSHELRSPMTAIVGWTDLLRQGVLDEKRRDRALEIIAQSALAQTRLVDDLLDLSRIVMGKVRLSTEPLYVAAAVERAVESIRPAAEAKNIQIKTTLDPKAGPIIADEDRIQQIVWNLLSNAVKFTPKNGSVQVFLEQHESVVELQVIDSGVGISSEFLPYVFDRFRQADASNTREHSGMGIGLAIVRHLVELHGGAVTVTSAGENSGATFVVTLPVRTQRDNAASRAGQPAAVSTRTGRLELKNLRVLVVDDHVETANLIETILEMKGAIVTIANSTRDALQLLTATQPDILISDIGMPESDGYALIRSVRELGPPYDCLPALALTAYAREEDRSRAFGEGFTAHLAKPILADTLVSIVASMVGRVSERHPSS